MAFPASCPGYQAWSTAGTASSQGISTGPPVWSTTTVRGFAAATAATSSSWRPGSVMSSQVAALGVPLAGAADEDEGRVGLRGRPRRRRRSPRRRAGGRCRRGSRRRRGCGREWRRTRARPRGLRPAVRSTSPTTGSQPSSKKVRPGVQPVQASATRAPSTSTRARPAECTPTRCDAGRLGGEGAGQAEREAGGVDAAVGDRADQEGLGLVHLGDMRDRAREVGAVEPLGPERAGQQRLEAVVGAALRRRSGDRRRARRRGRPRG